MSKLTIESLKKLSKNFDGSILYDPYTKFRISKSRLHSFFILNIITFYSDKELKNFIKNEMIKLTREDIKEISYLKSINVIELSYSLIRLLLKIENPSTEKIQFLILYAWKIFYLFNNSTNKKGLMNFIKLFCFNTFDRELFTKINLYDALLKLDYVDYFNPNEHKKEIFEIQLNIK